MYTLFFSISKMVHWLQHWQGRTDHSGNETLVAKTFTISNTKCQKMGLLEKFWGPFGFFLKGMSQRPFDPSSLLNTDYKFKGPEFVSWISRGPFQGWAFISRKNGSGDLVVLSHKARCLCFSLFLYFSHFLNLTTGVKNLKIGMKIYLYTDFSCIFIFSCMKFQCKSKKNYFFRRSSHYLLLAVGSSTI
jgi:hypothetical protein